MLAGRLLFEPLAPWLAALADAHPPSLERLQGWLETARPRPVSGGGAPLRFVAAMPDGASYELGIHRTGCVPTRADNWHDAFNALVWLRFPCSKAALNARHVCEPRADGMRGAARDAATLFDESGVIVLCTDAAIVDALRRHRWREVFVERRADLAQRLRCVIFGHALYDQMRTPFHGLCGKVLFVGMPTADADYASLDARLAGCLRDPAFLATPAALHPLPMLGLPGVTPASEDPAYYDDLTQFRPPRRGVRQAMSIG